MSHTVCVCDRSLHPITFNYGTNQLQLVRSVVLSSVFLVTILFGTHVLVELVDRSLISQNVADKVVYFDHCFIICTLKSSVFVYARAHARGTISLRIRNSQFKTKKTVMEILFCLHTLDTVSHWFN